MTQKLWQKLNLKVKVKLQNNMKFDFQEEIVPKLPQVCEKYKQKVIGCQSEEIILAGFERSGVLWTAKNLVLIIFIATYLKASPF